MRRDYVPNWTLTRMFQYTVMTGNQKLRLLDKMRQEGGLAAAPPERY
jgi:hypothetical protein